MVTRIIGLWSVCCDLMEIGDRTVQTEDGPMQRAIIGPMIVACHHHGRMYTSFPASLEEGAAFVAALPEDFNAKTHPAFGFWRVAYSSLDWSPEEEFGLMDNDEQRHYLECR